MRQNHDSVVMRLTESQLEEFRETFNAFDKDMGGTIDGDELGDLMRTLGQEPTEMELEMVGRHPGMDVSAHWYRRTAPSHVLLRDVLRLLRQKAQAARWRRAAV